MSLLFTWNFVETNPYIPCTYNHVTTFQNLQIGLKKTILGWKRCTHFHPLTYRLPYKQNRYLFIQRLKSAIFKSYCEQCGWYPIMKSICLDKLLVSFLSPFHEITLQRVNLLDSNSTLKCHHVLDEVKSVKCIKRSKWRKEIIKMPLSWFCDALFTCKYISLQVPVCLTFWKLTASFTLKS